jgi:hypothetical protein
MRGEHEVQASQEELRLPLEGWVGNCQDVGGATAARVESPQRILLGFHAERIPLEIT